MGWIRLLYEEGIKNHVVHDSCLSVVLKEIKNKYNKLPLEQIKESKLMIDPGGMLALYTEPKILNYVDDIIYIKPEHILSSIICWASSRVMSQKELADNVVKVYLSEYQIIVLPEKMYNEIGLWLALNKQEGYIARMEIMEAIGNIPGMIILPPPTEGEA